MCGAPDNCATQMSLTLTLSRQRERELEAEPNPLTPFPVKEGGTEKGLMTPFCTWPLVEDGSFGAGWYWFRSRGRLGWVDVAQRVANYFVNGVDEDHF